MIPMSIVALTLDVLRARYAPVHVFIDRFFGFMMRPAEKKHESSRLVFNGATWTTVSFTLLILIFPDPIAVVAFSIFMIGDAAAALVGIRWGRHPFARGRSTIEGSATFFVSAACIAFLIAAPASPVALFSVAPSSLLAGVFVATALEAYPLQINDNLLAPMGAALSMVAVANLF